MLNAPAPVKVRYHGSMTDHHGLGVIVGPCPCEAGFTKPDQPGAVYDCADTGLYFELRLDDGRPLRHVRAASFTRL